MAGKCRASRLKKGSLIKHPGWKKAYKVLSVSTNEQRGETTIQLSAGKRIVCAANKMYQVVH